MLLLKRAILVLLCCWLPFTADAAERKSLTADQIKTVDKAVQAEMAKQQIIGLAIGIIQDGEIRYLKGYGLADKEKKELVTTKSMFRWASCSKPVTAIAALQLVEQGKLDLNTSIRKLVPEFPLGDSEISTRQLLCHQGGVVHYKNGKVVRTKRTYPKANPFQDVVLALDTFKESPLVCKPGEKFSYTTHGYILLSAVVERAGKKRFADQVKERILTPLKMTSMQPDYQWISISDRVTGYRKQNGKVTTSVDGDVSWKLGGGGYISNIEDMAKFAQGLVQRKLVSAETEARMWTAQKTTDGKATTYGLGFQVLNQGERLRVGHSGAQEKTRTCMMLYPREKSGVVVMTNCEWVNPVQVVQAIFTALK